MQKTFADLEYAAKRKTTHQVFDGTARYRDLVPTQLPPNLVSTIHLMIGLPDSPDLGNQRLITLRPSTT